MSGDFPAFRCSTTKGFRRVARRRKRSVKNRLGPGRLAFDSQRIPLDYDVTGLQ